MLQNAYDIALQNQCDKNIKADVLFEEEIVQKIVGHQIHFCK